MWIAHHPPSRPSPVLADTAPTAPMLPVPFAKMNGIGNSILVVDLRAEGTSLSPELARQVGQMPTLHFDQLMAIEQPRTGGTDVFVDIFNIDGTRAGACGNGTRCVAWYILRNDDRNNLSVETAGGLLLCRRLDADTYSIDMGEPRFGWQDIPLCDPVTDTASVALTHPPLPELASFAAVSMGNPHAIFFVTKTDAIELTAIGPVVENDPIFPNRVNASFAEVLSRTHVKLRVWERGAGATLACGSAACATLVAGVRAGLLDRTARIDLPGGSLQLTWREDGHVIMTGGVELEHEGTLMLDAFEPAA